VTREGEMGAAEEGASGSSASVGGWNAVRGAQRASKRGEVEREVSSNKVERAENGDLPFLSGPSSASRASSAHSFENYDAFPVSIACSRNLFDFSRSTKRPVV
jgi:hypothetical protein